VLVPGKRRPEVESRAEPRPNSFPLSPSRKRARIAPGRLNHDPSKQEKSASMKQPSFGQRYRMGCRSGADVVVLHRQFLHKLPVVLF